MPPVPAIQRVQRQGILSRVASRVAKALNVTLQPVDGRSGWWPVIRESYTGAWQSNVEVTLESVLTNPFVYACLTLIAGDIAKLRPMLMSQDANGIWTETRSAAFSPVLRKPNHYQTRIQFFEHWMLSKLTRGNTYVLKYRDDRGVVVRMYVLDPTRVTALVAPDGSVYYRLLRDDLSGVGPEDIVVPASEMIHDTGPTLLHTLYGVGPISAIGVAAIQGLRIQDNSATFFANGSQPGGVLTAPGAISDETAARLKAAWDANYTGSNAGKVAVVGDGLKYEPMMMKATDSQLLEQWKSTAETICAAFHVPMYMVAGPMPSYNNVQALAQQYYNQCLQMPIECIELLLDEGLGLTEPKDGIQYGVEFDLDGLLRMDTATQIKTLVEAVSGTLMQPNEARKKLGLPPTEGGDAIYMQQQNYSLAALAARDADDPFSKPEPAQPEEPAEDDEPADEADDETAELAFEAFLRSELVRLEHA